MNFLKNKSNSLLVVIFIVYWLFVLFMQVFDPSRLNQLKNSLAGQLLFPPTYKMYTSPPKNIVNSYYTFYEDDREILTIDVDSLYNAHILEGFPTLTVKRDIKQYFKLFNKPNFDMASEVYTYLQDSTAHKHQTIQKYLESQTYHSVNIDNQLHFSLVLKNKYPKLLDADSVVLLIHRKYNTVEMDPETFSKFASYISDTIWVNKSLKF